LSDCAKPQVVAGPAEIAVDDFVDVLACYTAAVESGNSERAQEHARELTLRYAAAVMT
jgi:hypothetical protein